MLGAAIRYLKSLPRDLDRRADAFEALAMHIEIDAGGAWAASRGASLDGSEVFLGRQGGGFVVLPDGRIYRGKYGADMKFDAVQRGLWVQFPNLIPLD